MEAEICIFMVIKNGLRRGSIFSNQECVNILGCSVTFHVFLMLVDNVCTIQALFVTKPLHVVKSRQGHPQR